MGLKLRCLKSDCFQKIFTMFQRCSRCCSKSLQFKIYFILIGIIDFIYGIIVSVNCIKKWNNTSITDYVNVDVVSVMIAIIVFIVVVHIGEIFCLINLSRGSLFVYLIGLVILACLSFSAIWISYINKLGIIDDLGRLYSNLASTVDIEKFERNFKCCGWEFISNRCTSISGVSCTTVIDEIVVATGNSTGNTLIPLVIIHLSEVLYTVFILVCYSGIDWKEIKPFIRHHNIEDDL